MRSEDLELLSKISSLDARSFEDVDELVDILLFQSGSAGRKEETDNSVLQQFQAVLKLEGNDWECFLIGTKAELNTPCVSIQNLLSTPDFSLTGWFFHHTCRVDLPAAVHQPFTALILSGCAEICSNTESVRDRLQAGDIFQSTEPVDVYCSFEAGTEALFYDFPLIRAARRKLRRTYFQRPVIVEEDGTI